MTTQELAEGIFWVETATHGGVLIEKARARALLSERALGMGQVWEEYLVYEQEHAMVVVFYEHPELYPWAEETLIEGIAEDTLRLAYPAYFEG